MANKKNCTDLTIPIHDFKKSNIICRHGFHLLNHVIHVSTFGKFIISFYYIRKSHVLRR